MASENIRKAQIQLELNRLRREAKSTDLIFLCKDIKSKKKVPIKAHKVLFSSISPLLKELFEIAQLKQPYETVIITLDSFCSNTVEKLIEYVYQGKVTINCREMTSLQRLCGFLKMKLPLNCNYDDYTDSSRMSEIICDMWQPEQPVDTEGSISDPMQWDSLLPDNSVNISNPKIESSVSIEQPITSDNLWSCQPDDFKLVTEAKYSIEKVKDESLELWEQYRVYVDSKDNQKLISANGVCNECEKLTGNRNLLTRHMRLVHDLIRKFKCNLCGYLTTKTCKFKRHMNSRHFNVRYFCDKCDHSFSTQYHLLRHQRIIHDKIRAYKCNICSYAAKRSELLKKHMEICHTDNSIIVPIVQ